MHTRRVFVGKRRTARPRAQCGVFLLLLVALLACGSSPPDTAALSRSELIIGVPEGGAQDAELGVGYLTSQITLEGLTQLGVEGRALPRLARRWSWEDDDRRLRLILRDDVFLHDGRQFDSQTAAEALAVAVAVGRNRAQYPGLADISAAIPDGPHQLVLEVRARSALLPEDLTVLLDLPAGPYRTLPISGDEREFERFDRYFRGTPSIERVVLKPLDTLRTGWASLLRGQLDMVYDVPADAVEFILNDEVHVASVPRWYQFLVAFNARRAPFQSPLVRRALNLAIDRDALLQDVFNGRGIPSTGPLWPQFWAYDSSVPPFPFDRAQAKSLLDAAGFRHITSAGPARPPARLRFVCLIPENFIVWERVALQVQRDLFTIGVDMQVKAVPFEEYNRLITDGAFDAVLIDLISGPTPARPFMFWRSARNYTGPYNVFGYENPEAERLFDVLRTTTSEAAVRTATQRLQRVMVDDPPALFLAWSERTRAIRRDVVIPPDGNTYDLMWTLWSWSRSPHQVASAP